MKYVEDIDFNNYLKAFRKLSFEKKKDMIERDMIDLLNVLDKLNSQKVEVPYDNELFEKYSIKRTDDVFLEVMFVYLNAIKELIASYVLEKEEGGNNE
ncbi:MAG: hypothetical protein IKR57_00685 [Bacilli bacterium]|nr:hypothetical protein [Bacilli bacterium]